MVSYLDYQGRDPWGFIINYIKIYVFYVFYVLLKIMTYIKIKVWNVVAKFLLLEKAAINLQSLNVVSSSQIDFHNRMSWAEREL